MKTLFFRDGSLYEKDANENWKCQCAWLDKVIVVKDDIEVAWINDGMINAKEWHFDDYNRVIVEV